MKEEESQEVNRLREEAVPWVPEVREVRERGTMEMRIRAAVSPYASERAAHSKQDLSARVLWLLLNERNRPEREAAVVGMPTVEAKEREIENHQESETFLWAVRTLAEKEPLRPERASGVLHRRGAHQKMEVIQSTHQRCVSFVFEECWERECDEVYRARRRDRPEL